MLIAASAGNAEGLGVLLSDQRHPQPRARARARATARATARARARAILTELNGHTKPTPTAALHLPYSAVALHLPYNYPTPARSG